RFPAGFKWSTATAAYQIEGATRADGRGPSIWDEFVRKLGKIRDNSTADVSSDSYHNYKEDVKLMKALGISHYRFSFSWSRIFPQGVGSVNPKGVQYYHDLIDVLLENDIKPMVTLYHWDLPQSLQDLGGWLNRDIVKWFRLYAVYCFKEYGSRVKYWLTLNEPNTQVHQGYCGVGGEHAPGGFQVRSAVALLDTFARNWRRRRRSRALFKNEYNSRFLIRVPSSPEKASHPSRVGELIADLSGKDKTLICLTAQSRRMTQDVCWITTCTVAVSPHWSVVK
ncbi:unnamed protein product, partial [Heligmosomoides polygyrus]|uniref:Klotho beta n=1 Tax=Heligmosomoides polygyrus TaxID=6339 RepID=A0A183FS52_HELPZ